MDASVTFSSIPLDPKLVILSYFLPHELALMQRVSRLFYVLAGDDALWSKFPPYAQKDAKERFRQWYIFDPSRFANHSKMNYYTLSSVVLSQIWFYRIPAPGDYLFYTCSQRRNFLGVIFVDREKKVQKTVYPMQLDGKIAGKSISEFIAYFEAQIPSKHHPNPQPILLNRDEIKRITPERGSADHPLYQKTLSIMQQSFRAHDRTSAEEMLFGENIRSAVLSPPEDKTHDALLSLVDEFGEIRHQQLHISSCGEVMSEGLIFQSFKHLVDSPYCDLRLEPKRSLIQKKAYQMLNKDPHFLPQEIADTSQHMHLHLRNAMLFANSFPNETGTLEFVFFTDTLVSDLYDFSLVKMKKTGPFQSNGLPLPHQTDRIEHWKVAIYECVIDQNSDLKFAKNNESVDAWKKEAEKDTTTIFILANKVPAKIKFSPITD